MDDALAQAEIAKLRAKLEEQDRQLRELRELKTAFLAIASHELRAPLTSVRSFIDLVRESGDLSAEQAHFLTISSNSVDRMLSLTNDLLDIERIEVGTMQLDLTEFDLPSLTKVVAEGFGADLQRRNLTLQFENYQPLEVYADLNRVQQILTNLISNAIKYSRPDGTITIKFETQNCFAVAHITDTGIGIAPEDQPRLFQRFFRASNASSFGARGNGLGLSIARALIERHGGKIWLESTIGVGSTFSFSLPLATAGARDQALAGEDEE